jgi:uncharacterized protein
MREVQSDPWRGHGQIRRARRAGLTAGRRILNIHRLMSAELPEILDAWRMVAGRREFEGRTALSALPRLRDALSDAEGEVEFALSFDHDALRVPYLELKLAAELPLQCQRTLQRFLFTVRTVQRLGLIRDEADEAALPPGYEPLLVEDELILAIPVVPVKPGTETVERDWPVPPEEQARTSPFAGLAALKKPN